jgi:hypothetical protein
VIVCDDGSSDQTAQLPRRRDRIRTIATGARRQPSIGRQPSVFSKARRRPESGPLLLDADLEDSAANCGR